MSNQEFSIARSRRWAAVASLVGALAITPSVASSQAHDRDMTGLFESFIGSGPQIGVTVRDVTAEDAATTRTGAVVEAVRANTPAAAAGVRAGDIVVSFDGEAVRSARQLSRLIDETPVGREVPVTVVREGNRVELKVAPAARPAAVVRPRPAVPGLNVVPPRPRVEATPFTRPGPGRLGIGVQDLTTQLREYFGAANGVLVTSVDANTPASAAGLQAGDVITKVNGETVTTTADLRRRVGDASGKVALTVVRNRAERTIEADLGAATSPAPTRRFSR